MNIQAALLCSKPGWVDIRGKGCLDGGGHVHDETNCCLFTTPTPFPLSLSFSASHAQPASMSLSKTLSFLKSGFFLNRRFSLSLALFLHVERHGLGCLEGPFRLHSSLNPLPDTIFAGIILTLW